MRVSLACPSGRGTPSRPRPGLGLQPDVEHEAVVVGLGDQRGPPLVGRARRAAGRRRMAREVGPGEQPVEQPAGEDRDGEERRVAVWLAPGRVTPGVTVVNE